MTQVKRIHVGIVCDQFGNFDRGGAEVQVDNTVKALNKIEGITTEIITCQSQDVERFNIVHFFKSSIAYFTFAKLLKNKGIPYVVSTIVYPENYTVDLLKYTIGHSIPILNKISWTKFHYFLWQNAAMLFPNTDKELKFLRDIGVKAPAKVIPNGLNLYEMDIDSDEETFYSHYPFLREKRFVLNVARIDKRKNQSRLVRACKDLDVHVVIIGNNLDTKEFTKVQELQYEKVHYLGPIFDKRVLFGAYKACAVFCLPSTMETPGIAAMEAAYFNKPIVITKFGGTEYYFKDKAYYVNWRSLDEIKKGIETMMNKKVVHTRELIVEFTWDRIAEMYVEMYKILFKE